RSSGPSPARAANPLPAAAPPADGSPGPLPAASAKPGLGPASDPPRTSGPLSLLPSPPPATAHFRPSTAGSEEQDSPGNRILQNMWRRMAMLASRPRESSTLSIDEPP